MKRTLVSAACLLAAALPARAQPASPLGGIWSLNRSLSQFPKELGFNVVSTADPTQPPPSSGGGGRRRGGGGQLAGSPFSGRRESYEDGQRVRLLTEEARNPPSRLIIVDNDSVVTMTNELGQSRVLRLNGQEDNVDIQGIPIPVTAMRDGAQIVVIYHVEQNRDLRYTYSVTGTPARLSVETEFLEQGNGDKVTRVYDSGVVSDSLAAAAAPAGGVPAGGVPASSSRESFDQRPGAEFRGLKDVGVLVEDLGPEATACGLKRDVLEDDLAARLSAGGLSVRRNSDEDTYVYVNVITSSLPNGTCVSRYDAYLYTHATAKLAYHEQPVLVQVSLMHRGNIGSSGVSAHAPAVAHALEGYIDIFLTQIRDANK